MSHNAFLAATERQQKRLKLVKPRQGFYVVVPPFYENWGTPELNVTGFMCWYSA